VRSLFFLLAILISATLPSQNTFLLSGTVKAQNGELLSDATVLIEELNKYDITNSNGKFYIRGIKPGTYTLQIDFIGFKTLNQKVNISENTTINFSLEEESESLDGITITAKSEANRINQKALTITSLDVKKVQDQALGVEEVLKATTGVVVRQSGGLGSNVNINLNGLTGQAVRIFYDGIPLDVFGNVLQVNNIPVDALARVDIYKGVMPIQVGTDALGGGINLVSAKQYDDNLRTSYSIGSFNTHRFTFSGRKNISNHTSFAINSFFNYSDNNYKMRDILSVVEGEPLPDGTIPLSEERIDAERFHSKHVSGYLEGSVAFKDLSWTDQLELRTTFSTRSDEVQQTPFLVSTAVGEAERESFAFAQLVDYRKSFLNDKLKVRYFGVFSIANDKIQDSTTNVYNWRGEKLTGTRARGSELPGGPTARDADNIGTTHRLNAEYEILKSLKVEASNFYRYAKIEGEDPFGIRIPIGGVELDPNTVPSKFNQNIFGLGLNSKLFNDKLDIQAFYKSYYYNAESIDFLASGATEIPIRSVNDTNSGFGFGAKYDLSATVFLRASFERAVRLPTEREVFGDFIGTVPNFVLRPEKSNNINLGVQYNKRFDNDLYLSLRVDGFIRDQEDLIRITQFGAEGAQFVNEDEVENKGVEFALRIDPFKTLSINGNFTYQSSEIISSGNSSGGSLDKPQVPNIPTLFYNINANYTFENIFNSDNSLQLTWTYLFTDEFSINEVDDIDTANPDFIIPKQNVHNAGIIYNMPTNGLVLSFNVQNVFNELVYDNFRIPRPGINYAFKINYTL
jgi:outer membrane receptor protein involved in Fe transport